MPQYAAVLGHQPHISIAELAATVPGFTLERVEQKMVALFSSSDDLDDEFFNNLGGCVLLAKRVTEADVALEDIPRILSAEVAHVKKKIIFGLRCFGVPRQEIKNIYRRSKDILKKQNRPCRYVGNENKPAATPLLVDCEVVSGKRGVELFLINEERGLWVGKTIAVQDIDAYTWRDMQKPVRDTTVGLLPPKLAQMMLNLGAWAVKTESGKLKTENDAPKRKKKEIYTVFDPFCGTGVIPMECLLRGWNVVASDMSLKAVNGCTKNLEWIRKEKKILKKDVSDSVTKHDAAKPFAFKELPHMVVTETSLGPSIAKSPSQREVQKFKKESEALQAAFLKNAAKTLPGVPLVCTWPFWRAGGLTVRLESVWNVLAEAGYVPVLPDGTPAEGDGKPSLLYMRKDQFVGREIVVLMPKSRG